MTTAADEKTSVHSTTTSTLSSSPSALILVGAVGVASCLIASGEAAASFTWQQMLELHDSKFPGHCTLLPLLTTFEHDPLASQLHAPLQEKRSQVALASQQKLVSHEAGELLEHCMVRPLFTGLSPLQEEKLAQVAKGSQQVFASHETEFPWHCTDRPLFTGLSPPQKEKLSQVALTIRLASVTVAVAIVVGSTEVPVVDQPVVEITADMRAFGAYVCRKGVLMVMNPAASRRVLPSSRRATDTATTCFVSQLTPSEICNIIPTTNNETSSTGTIVEPAATLSEVTVVNVVPVARVVVAAVVACKAMAVLAAPVVVLGVAMKIAVVSAVVVDVAIKLVVVRILVVVVASVALLLSLVWEVLVIMLASVALLVSMVWEVFSLLVGLVGFLWVVVA